MVIRDMTRDEVPVMLEGARQFFAEGKLHGEFNPESFITGWRQFLDVNIGILIGAFEGEKFCGAIGGSVFPDFPTGDLVASEFFWYCLPETRGAGLRLFKAFERKAKERNAKRIIMVHLANLNSGEMGRLFERFGYALCEHVYIKKI